MSLPLPEALKDLDYMQLTLHGGRGCFHIAKDGICGRADFWAGHPVYHSFVSLQEAVTKYGQACREAALKEVDKREPLSEPQLFVIWHALPDDDGAFPDFVDAARAVEQAHHITEKALKP